ncbi:hypothetical protein QBC47DRAFT_392048 [Echria macrotheca]|uniref:DM13 domain-containing protein n=1 Tax=Echria macrotheca TaxID=438768 RepID=A0AAJ0F7A8_9PEZI|nr:hypothetical protein QBC47DRAFT_392048 [Echria macrotheca]
MQYTVFLAFALASAAFGQSSSQTKMGWSGTLSSLDGGLGGTVTVTNATALTITNYALADASAPALYWWGSKSASIGDGSGFRISNEHVAQAATTNTHIIVLDAGKTPADFVTVGLWCEKFSANFGQASLTAPSGAGSSPTSSANTPQTTATTTAGGMSSSASGRISVGVWGVAVGIPALLFAYFSI